MTTTMPACDTFRILVHDAQSCRACPRMEGRRRVLSPANGPLSARVLFIAEAPGRLGGDKGGVPLTGDASGRNFLRYLTAAGLTRDDVFVTNAALCNPRTERGTNAPPSAAELRACSSFLSRTLTVVQPQIIATLGGKALAALHLLCPHAYTLRDHAATAVAWNDMTLFPLYHPSPQVVISPTGRNHAAQEADYAALRRLLESHPA
jgi:uracil-DNA glycosylase family 4